jgi:hypothetical protein
MHKNCNRKTGNRQMEKLKSKSRLRDHMDHINVNGRIIENKSHRSKGNHCI